MRRLPVALLNEFAQASVVALGVSNRHSREWREYGFVSIDRRLQWGSANRVREHEGANVDDSRFDAIARLAGQSNRRSALRQLAASGLGVTVLYSVSEDADAKCVNPDKKCKKKNGKKRKCCGGAKCQGKRCRCQDNSFACGAFCCLAGAQCVGEGNAAICQNGGLQPQDKCEPNLPGQCSTGKCGCNGNNCACRDADCKAKGAACNGNLSCCNGVCNGGTCSA